MRKFSFNKFSWIWVIALFNVGLHLVFYQNLEYQRDELLYFSLGQHPDFGYASVPPLIGLLAGLVGTIFGYSVLAVKLVPALFSGIMVLLGSALARELGGKAYAQVLTAIGLVIAPLTLRTFFLFQPVFLDVFFWTLLFYWLIRYLNTESDRYLYLLGGTLGLALLNKYLLVFMAASMLLSLLITRPALFQKKALYLAALIGIAVFSPNILWQFSHDWPVLQHMEALKKSQLVHVNRADFLFDQLLFTLSVAPLVWAGLYFLFREKTFRSVALTAVFAVALLALSRGKSYYTIGIYPTLIAAGAVWWEGTLVRRWGRILLPALMTALILPILPLGLPIFPVDGLVSYFQRLEDRYGLEVGRRFEDGTIHSLPQDYADMLGWEELTSLVDEAYQKTTDKDQVLIYCENYGQAGAIAVIGKKYGLPEPLSFHESFLYWAPHQLNHEVKELIYVNDELGDDIRQFFADVQEIGRIQNPHARERGTQVYLCRGPKQSMTPYIQKKIPEMTPF